MNTHTKAWPRGWSWFACVPQSPPEMNVVFRSDVVICVFLCFFVGQRPAGCVQNGASVPASMSLWELFLTSTLLRTQTHTHTHTLMRARYVSHAFASLGKIVPRNRTTRHRLGVNGCCECFCYMCVYVCFGWLVGCLYNHIPLSPSTTPG